jgi:hypothetical protein
MFRVWSVWIRVWGTGAWSTRKGRGLWVNSSGFMIQGVDFRIEGESLGSKMKESKILIYGFRVSDSGLP